MKTRSYAIMYPVVCLLLLVPSQISYAEEVKELQIKGGLLYQAWSDSAESMPCGITIHTPTAVPDRYPLQVVMLIDASYHMEGAPIQQAKASAKAVLDLLADTDMFGLITYSQYARDLFSIQPLNPNNRRNAVSAIDRSKYEKGRNLSEGLLKAGEQFNKFKGQRSSGQYIILITNGNPDKGVTDFSQLLDQVTKLAEDYNVHFTTIGYDQFYDENFLIDCARKTGGRAYFIEEMAINTMTAIVIDEVKRITETCVLDVTVELITPSASSIDHVYGGALRDDKIYIGNLAAGLKQSILFELTGRPKRRRDLEVNVDYMEPVRKTPRTERIYVDIPVGTGHQSYDTQFGPLLLNYTIQKGLAEAIEQIRDGESYVRKDFAESFKQTIKQLEQDNVSLKSDYLAESIKYYKQVRHDIENGAIEDALLTKKIKYHFLELTYGERVK